MGPAAPSIPLITPVLALMLRPLGKPLAAQVYGGVPPVAVMVYENAEPSVVSGSWVAEAMLRVAVMAMLVGKARAPIMPLASVACTVSANVPAVVGVPLRNAVQLGLLLLHPFDGLIVSPGGSPLGADQL